MSKDAQPECVHSIWDNGGETQDRYTVALNKDDDVRYHDCLAFDDTPTKPLGFSQFSTCAVGKHLGKRLRWAELPVELRTHVIERLSE